MYGYAEYIPLTEEQILLRTTEEDIFKIVIKEEISIEDGVSYSAPYRIDNEPNCKFRRYDNKLYFCDWADEHINRDCFSFIRACYQLRTQSDTLKFINYTLKLGLGDSTTCVSKVIKNNIEVKQEKKKNLKKTITILPRNFNGKDKQFWSKYGISKQNLIDDKVVPIILYQSISNKEIPFTVKPFNVTYAFTDFQKEKKKIYTPHSPKGKGKWFTNCNQNDIGGMRFLDRNADKLIIQKSYKDWRVIKNEGVNTVWFQNEGMIPSKDILLDLLSGYTEIIIWFDNDSAGIAKARIVRDYINTLLEEDIARIVFLPPRLLLEEIKDPSDLRAKQGREPLMSFIQERNLL